MAILLTLLTFLLFILASYMRSQRTSSERRPAAVPARRVEPEFEHEAGFAIPKGYSFHPGHTWALEENTRNVRVGIDGLAAELLGKVDKIEIEPLYRWIRQGQKVWTLHQDGIAVDMVSPIEGVVVAANPNVLRDPSVLTKDPYGEGWVLIVQSPMVKDNLKNLLRGPLVRAWMESSLNSLKELVWRCSPQLAFAQDGGVPVSGLLARVDEDLRVQLIREFFVT